jgi:hypothetical protein
MGGGLGGPLPSLPQRSSEGGLRPLPKPPPSTIDCAGEAGARSAAVPKRGWWDLLDYTAC